MFCTTEDLFDLANRGQKFGTVYADPPWLYHNKASEGAACNHYEGMTVRELMRLPVKWLAAETAHLHLWTTNAFLFDCKDIMEAWGFEYKGMLIWIKDRIGMGNYWRVTHELLLLGTRGPKCAFKIKNIPSWIKIHKGRHSAKPTTIRRMLEKVSPSPRLELFARPPICKGWVPWGNEIRRADFRKDCL